MGQLQDDAAYVLVSEKITARKLQIVRKTLRVEKERVAAPTGKETILASIRHARLPAGRHRCPLKDNLPTLAGSSGVRALDPAHRRALCAVRGSRKLHAEGYIGN